MISSFQYDRFSRTYKPHYSKYTMYMMSAFQYDRFALTYKAHYYKYNIWWMHFNTTALLLHIKHITINITYDEFISKRPTYIYI